LFHLSSSDPSILAQLPDTITLPAGADRATFGLAVPIVSQTTSVTVTATGAGSSISAVLTLLPAGSPAPARMIDTIFATPLTVAAGSPSTATIRLTSPAPAGGLVVGLGTNLPLSAGMPAAVTVPAGTTVATVPITTFVGFPNSTTTVELRAWAGATIVHNGINVVTGDVQQQLGIGTTTLDAPVVGGFATVVGGTSLTAHISITGPAPAGGALVTLVSTDTTVATVPTSVDIPAGASSASFTVQTKVVSATTSSNIGGGFAGGFNVATLRVTPASSTNPPPGGAISAPSLLSPSADARFAAHSTVTFDWSGVAGAATYTIQISSDDKFSSASSMIVNQTVSASQFVTATLPTMTLWWRVRANGASGSSSFTGARRFELK
jgi:hypothetical protein